MLAGCPACDPPEKRLKITLQTDSSLQRKLEITTPLEITTLEANMCTRTHVHTQTKASDMCCWKHIWSRWKRGRESRADRLLQAVEFNAAVNITSLSYPTSMQLLLINTTVRSTWATSHMTAMGHPFPPASRDRLQMELGVLAHVQPWTPSGRSRKRKRKQEPNIQCHPGICLIAALWSIAQSSDLFRNYPGMQRQPESSLWSLTAASDLPKCQGKGCLRQAALPRLLALVGLSGRGKQAGFDDGYTCQWVFTECQRAVTPLC